MFVPAAGPTSPSHRGAMGPTLSPPKGGEGRSEGGGMPQLEVSTFLPQLVWLAITFCLLYVLMARIGLPRVGGIIEARRRRIDDDLARAAQLKSEAEAVMAAYQQALATARSEAQAVVKQTTDRFAAEAAERQRQLSEALAEQTAAAERQIAAAKQNALAEMHGIAVDVGRSIAEKVAGSTPDAARLARAVDQAIAERAR
jgi:F-type H+-transporting ATPase subunit b